MLRKGLISHDIPKKTGYLLERNRGEKTEYFVDKRSTWLMCIR